MTQKDDEQNVGHWSQPDLGKYIDEQNGDDGDGDDGDNGDYEDDDVENCEDDEDGW